MVIRPYEPRDRGQVLKMHERQCIKDGLGYVFPNPADPRQLGAFVAEEDGKIVAMATARRILEGQTILDPNYGGPSTSGPIARWLLLSQLISRSARHCYENGYGELLAATHPAWRGYGRRLVNELGFTKDLRAHYYLDLAAKFGGD